MCSRVSRPQLQQGKRKTCHLDDLSSVQVALRKCSEQVALRKCSAPVAPCKRLCNCSVQFAERKLLCASDSAQVALRKCCRSCGNVLRVPFLYLKVAIFQPELREHAPHTTSVLKSCDFPTALRLYLKVAIFQPELQEHAPRTTDCESRRASHETTSKGHFASNKFARRHSESASTRTIPAEGRARLAEIVKSPQFLNLDRANLRRGSHAACRNRKKSSVFEPRPRESLQRVARGLQKS